ncbi:MAG: alkene reductase [Nevskiaceae bacterium]|nr:MAG: alkene reductase [Nevskiaceae bacterium]TBR71482.1 MAG: alkene reductase [Nevskiaceae bacterium]
MNAVPEKTRSLAHSTIWDPITIGRMHLPHRLAMAPMTRSRANPDGTPGPLAAEYYAQRAGFGLLISEGTQPSADGQGYLATPGIHADAHVTGWSRVASAVHEKGGHLFIQLMHAGRISHPDNTPHHRQPVAPSAIAPGVEMFTANGPRDIPVPRALSTEEVRATVQDFADAAERAIEAGADGVEIHGANGYLIQQFLASNANQRDDTYGGSIDKRVRFALEVVAAVAERIGPERTGIRLSPGSQLGGIDEGSEGPDLYRRLVAGLAEFDLAYLHVMHFGNDDLLRDIRHLWPNTLLVNRANRTLEALGVDIEAGLADVAPVARWALANPDFIERIRRDAPLNELDPTTLYGGDAAGYTDYPVLDEAVRQSA